MTIVGSLNAGLTGDYEMLLTKSVLDLISSAMLSVSLGIGVMFAAAFVLVFQGGIVLAAGFLEPYLFITNVYYHVSDFMFFFLTGYLDFWSNCKQKNQ